MKLPKIPKHHPLLPYSANVMLRDCRQILARELRRQLLTSAGFTWASKTLRAYVLIGYPKDDLTAADNRLIDTVKAGFWPMAMLYRDGKNEPGKEWKKLQREWARPAIMNELAAQIRDFM